MDPVLIQPETAAEVADALRRASDAGTSIVIRGAGTKDGWGRLPSRIDAVLDMRRLNRILAHEHGDMTATIEAGATLHDANAALAVHGQTLPLDPPHGDRATIGGLLATNDSGPLRHRYGTPRDLVIGIQLATTDGVLSKAGGQVVKNVAGYDLSKLVTGSFGSLAAIVSATFKLAPLPAASKTMRIAVRDEAALAGLVCTMMASQLEPVAFEVQGDSPPDVVQALRPAVLLRFASLPEVVNAQIEQAKAGLKACTTSIEILDGDAEQSLWLAQATEQWDAPGAIVRASWLPAEIADGLKEPRQARHDVAAEARGRRPGLIRGSTAGAAPATSIPSGCLSALSGATDALKSLAMSGERGQRQPLFDSLKRAFDPMECSMRDGGRCDRLHALIIHPIR
jgi:glycolate oxidase FAD binding subunit